MKIGKPLLAAIAAALAVTLLFTWLPHASWQQGDKRGDVAVFRVSSAVRLTNSNLVDVLVAVKLNERLEKAEWSNGILSLDMRVDPISGRPSLWFEDVEKLVRVSFLQLENVKRVLIRMVEKQQDDAVLLAAVDVRKTDEWLISEMQHLSSADPVHDEQWRKRLRVSFTSAWEKRFGPAVGYSVKPSFILQSE
ncbi:hypothetical protein FHS16_004475 [Paenibacillus endophyticus]|uniref:DUF4390 domain-containing protein n=1 Tax=Paenibacillus endophyticus TaxID=1294268 RepID=A0A7W5CB04_9BACL|nr:hypothetical protein [Paenibacillus endophyticus]MBB3154393.1 hypothetical protein [Paenibacillus endophyticus]